MSVRIVLDLLFVLIVSSAINGEDLEEGCYDVRTIKDPYLKPRTISVTRKDYISSPGFKENKPYPDYIYCAYQLQASPGLSVRIHFNTLDIDSTDVCGADVLSLYDFDSSGQGVLIGMYCGSQIPYDYVSKSNAVQIVLRTDGFAGRRGFNITYSPQSSNRVCSIGKKQCRNRNCVDYSVVCDGNDDCGDGTDEENCRGQILPYSECGRPDIDPVTFADFDRIVGGQEAVYGSWPWMADLQMNYLFPNGHTCGGALLNAQWVLTAAHCVQDPVVYNPMNLRIHIGNHQKFEKDPWEQVRYAERIVIYDDLTPEQLGDNLDLNNDIALIKLNAPVKFSKYAKPVCLPDPGIKLNITSNCYATGWGATRGTGSSDRLKQAYHPVQSEVMCKRLVGEQFVSSTMVCAGSMAPLNGVCHGDSGGPLVCETSRGQWSIVGVASYVTEGNEIEGLCGLKGRPSVFNRVTAKSAWIRRIINRYS